MAGLDVTGFNTMFPEFSAVATATIQTYIDAVNFGFFLVSQDVTDQSILNIYYWLVAHYVAVGTNIAGGTATPAPSYTLTATSTGAVSASFANIQGTSSDASFMTSTRYGQMYFTLSKQQYIQNFYLNSWC